MATAINESVSVDLVSSHRRGQAFPYVLSWRHRRYVISKIGLHHTVYQGRTLLHIFSVSDGETFFRLEFNTESLTWKLTDVASKQYAV